MKDAMDKDLSNPRTIEIITHAQSDSESLHRPSSFYSADGQQHFKPSPLKHLSGGLTPPNQKTSQNQNYFGKNNNIALASNYATAQPTTVTNQ